MPQRHRPRLKRYAFACDWCGVSTVKFYPSRESVRNKLSPYRFCSSTCQRDHWEARRRAAWSGAPYPCAQCGAAITPQQAAGRRRVYCSDTCKQKAARERRRRNPAGAVMAARQQFKEAWQDAVKAVHVFVEFDLYGAPVVAAHNLAVLVFQDESSSESEREQAIQHICVELDSLDGPRWVGEPDRQGAASGRWQDWWTWWKETRQRCESAYEHRLEVAWAATAELRKKERVAARRAETARLRRAAASQDRDTAGSPQPIPEVSER